MIYCELNQKVVEYNERFHLYNCATCPFLAGTLQGDGIECLYEDSLSATFGKDLTLIYEPMEFCDKRRQASRIEEENKNRHFRSNSSAHKSPSAALIKISPMNDEGERCMDFIEKVQDIAQRIPKTIEHIQTEEATKSAYVMPLIQALGYDIFNPQEVIPEFVADVGIKKGEKVDYAIKKDDAMVMLIECKWCGSKLDGCHASQLYRYFSVTDARFGILTNGVQYKFFSDIDETNKMDSKPFFEFDMLDFDEQKVAELKNFTKDTFDLGNILTTASDLKYTIAIKKVIREELENPSPDFVRFFTSRVYCGKLYQQVMEQFTPIVKKALSQSLMERVNKRIQTALNAGQEKLVKTENSKPDIRKGNDGKTIADKTPGADYHPGDKARVNNPRSKYHGQIMTVTGYSDKYNAVRGRIEGVDPYVEFPPDKLMRFPE